MSRAVYLSAQRNWQPARPTPRPRPPPHPGKATPGPMWHLPAILYQLHSDQGDHLSGKPGNVREFHSCQGNVRDFTKSQENVREKILSGKSFLKLSIVSWIFASKQVRYWVGVCSVSNMKYIVTDDALLHSYPHHWQYGNDTLNMPSGAEECCELSGNFTLFGELSSWVIIPTVSSGATWTLSLRNFLWTCSTQVESTFATSKVLHIDITATLSQMRVENPKEQGNLRSELHTDITGLKNSCTVRASLVTFTCAAIWRVHL